MASRQFVTVSIELLDHAEAAADHFEKLGYSVSVEAAKFGYPFTPTLVCKRERTLIIVEVDKRIDMPKLDAWARFGQSCRTDTRVALVVPASASLSIDDVEVVRTMQVGLYRSHVDHCLQLTPEFDLNLQVSLPHLDSLHSRIRKKLGHAYEQFDRGFWREGFEDACQALEVEARKYLWRAIASNRIGFETPAGKAYTPTQKQVDKMTMGDLGRTFREIDRPNYADSRIGEVLTQINKDRVGVVHHKTRPATEARLRANVGGHMWRVVAALGELLGVK